MPEIADAGYGGFLTNPHAALAGAGDHGAIVGDAEAGADPGLMIDVLALPGADTDLLDDLLHEGRHEDGKLAVETDIRLLLHDLDAEFALAGVVGLDG